MRIFKLLITSVILITTMSFSAFAGQWKQDNIGYWYQNDDNSYPKNTWQAIDKKLYFFKDNGYMADNQWVGNYYVGADGAMLTNTTTPDGYKVGADGVWIQSGNNNSNTTYFYNNNSDSIGNLPISRTAFEGYTVIVNTHSKKYHVPGCKESLKIADKNIGYSNDIATLEAAGYQACKVCHR